MFWTDAIQTALNSRRIGGGGVRFCTEFTGAWPHAVSKLLSTKSERTSTLKRVLGIGQQCKSDARETAPRYLDCSRRRVQVADTGRADGFHPILAGHRTNG